MVELRELGLQVLFELPDPFVNHVDLIGIDVVIYLSSFLLLFDNFALSQDLDML